MINTTTPHNDFFYAVLSRKEKAKVFFERYLPEDLRDIVDLSQLTLCESKHISDKGKTLYNDILYRTKGKEKQEMYLYLVCEHQNVPIKHMPLRIAGYDVFILQDHSKQENKAYPFFVNFVLYTGIKPWKYSLDLKDYYPTHVPDKYRLHIPPIQLVQLAEQPEDIMYKEKELGFYFQACRCVKQQDPYQSVKKAMEDVVFRENFQNLAPDLKSLFIFYVARFVDESRYSLKDFVNLLMSSAAENQKIMTSIIGKLEQELKQKFYQEGEAQGEAQGRRVGIAKGRVEGIAEGITVGREGEAQGRQGLAQDLIREGYFKQEELSRFL